MAGKIIMTSPDFRRRLKDAGAAIVTKPQQTGEAVANQTGDFQGQQPAPDRATIP
ncbi:MULTISPECIES: hypothetical protein [Burkholderiaceae]|uniref:hypothetical protein n=1 Tax=Burkholderiaceae TaxID=119060 RepID=UPI0028BE8765|nr:hypothetical protein [Cupriavidus sp.]